MKQKLLAGLMCLATAFISLAEEPTTEQHRMLAHGKTWVYEKYGVGSFSTDGGERAAYIYATVSTLTQDTIIQGKNCVRTLLAYNMPSFVRDYTLPGGLRVNIVNGLATAHYFEQIFCEENGKIYMYSPETKSFLIIMDFNLEPGEQLERIDTSGFTSTQTVIQKDEIEVEGIKRRRITFLGDDAWVEGIGTEWRTLGDYVYSGVVSGFPFRMVACYEKDECVFTVDDFKAPALSSLREVESATSGKGDSPLFDLNGRQVRKAQKGQIYIQNHKKIIY